MNAILGFHQIDNQKIQNSDVLIYSFTCTYQMIKTGGQKRSDICADINLAALFLLPYRCIVTINVLWLFLTVSGVGLQYVIVVFPDHTHLLFTDIAHSLVCQYVALHNLTSNVRDIAEKNVMLFCES